jgi:hypothetical protein
VRDKRTLKRQPQTPHPRQAYDEIEFLFFSLNDNFEFFVLKKFLFLALKALAVFPEPHLQSTRPA